MAWFNDGIDVQSLGASTSLTHPMFPPGTMPEGYIAGFTILRLLVRLTWGAAAADLVNALAAFYVGARNLLTVPPNLNSDLLDYYLYAGLQLPSGGVESASQMFDIRSKRRIRGEDRTVFFRVTNNEVTAMQVGMEYRALITPS